MPTPTPSSSQNSMLPHRPAITAMVVVTLTVLAIFLGVKTWNEVAIHRTIGRPADVRDTFTIDGEGKVTGAPTLAQISFGLLTEGTDVAKMQQENTQKVNMMINAMKQLGVESKDLQTSQYSISPRYDYKDGTSKIIGYQISQNVSVKLRDLSKIGDALTKVGQLGGNQVNGPTFTIDDPSELNQQARVKALEDARKKANDLSGVLGVKVGRVVTFTETNSAPQPPMPMYRAMDMAEGSAVAQSAPAIQAGSLDVTSHVSVTFEVL